MSRTTAAELAEALAAGTVTSVEATQKHLDRIAEIDGRVHAFLHVDADGALEQAAASDTRRAGGQALSGAPAQEQQRFAVPRILGDEQ